MHINRKVRPEILDSVALLVLDAQDAFIETLYNKDAFLKRAAFAIEAARALNIHTIFTEQAPEKLGRTHSGLYQLAQNPKVFPKRCFSALGAPGIESYLRDKEIYHLLVIGIEVPVCVYQTGLQATEEDVDITFLSDALGSRRQEDEAPVLAALARLGCQILPSEAVFYSLLADTDNPYFRPFNQVVKAFGEANFALKGYQPDRSAVSAPEVEAEPERPSRPQPPPQERPERAAHSDADARPEGDAEPRRRKRGRRRGRGRGRDGADSQGREGAERPEREPRREPPQPESGPERPPRPEQEPRPQREQRPQREPHQAPDQRPQREQRPSPEQRPQPEEHSPSEERPASEERRQTRAPIQPDVRTRSGKPIRGGGGRPPRPAPKPESREEAPQRPPERAPAPKRELPPRPPAPQAASEPEPPSEPKPAAAKKAAKKVAKKAAKKVAKKAAKKAAKKVARKRAAKATDATDAPEE